MEDYLLRRKTWRGEKDYFDCEGGKQKIIVTRERNTSGYPAITARVGSKTFIFDKDGFGDEYEQAAYDFAQTIIIACNDPCKLPSLD